jgi:hypothetical protein
LANELRSITATGIERLPGLRSVLSRVSFELGLLVADGGGDTYGAGYYGTGRNPLNRGGVTGLGKQMESERRLR